MENYDVIIIGAGVTGTAIARELSRYQCKGLRAGKRRGCLLRYLKSKQCDHSRRV